jgi:hypothetical protein
VYDLDAGSVLVQGTAEYASNEYSVYGIYAQTKSVLAGTFTSVATNHLALRKRASSVGAPYTEQGIGQGEFADGFESINGHLRFWHIDN